MLMKVAHLFGLEENQVATDHEHMLLRILTPLLKLYTGKQVGSSLDCLDIVQYFEYMKFQNQ